MPTDFTDSEGDEMSPEQFAAMFPGGYRMDKRPNLYKEHWRKGSWRAYFLTRNDFVDYMMILHRQVQHLGDNNLMNNERKIKARESWYRMYEEVWDDRWSLLKNWLIIIAIIITTIELIN